MEDIFSQSSDALVDGSANPPEGLPDGIYTYEGVDALYKKENGRWFKKIGQANYAPLQSGDVEERIKLLEEKAVAVPEDNQLIERFTNIQDIDVNQPVKQYKEVFEAKESPLVKQVEPVKKADEYKIDENNGVQTWQKKKEVKIQERIDPKTGQPMGMSYVNVYEDVTDPKKVAELNKKNGVQASTDKEQQIFTGYPGQEGSEYRINDDGLWETKRPGSNEFLTIVNPKSVSALNAHFKQNAEVFDDKKAEEIKRKNEYINNFNIRLNNVNKDLIGGSEGNAVETLSKLFPEFKFEQTGIMTDNIKVSKINNGVTVASDEISLDNFFDNTDKQNAQVLKDWLRTNVVSDLNNSYKAYNEAVAGVEKRISETIYGQDPEISKVVSDATSLDKTILNEQIRRDVSGLSSVFFPEETKKVKEAGAQLTKDYAKVVRDTYARVKDKSKEEQATAFMAIKTDDIIINAANNYSNEVKDNYNTFVSQQKNFNQYVNDINAKLKSGEISQEEYDNNYRQKIKDGAADLEMKGEKVKGDLTSLNYYVKGSEKAIASNLMIKEMTGTTAGAFGRSIVDGAMSIPTFIAGMNKEQRTEFIDSIVGVGTTEQYMQSKDRSILTTAALSIVKSMSAMGVGKAIGSSMESVIPGASQIGSLISLYAMGYNEMRDSLDGIKVKDKDGKYVNASISSEDKVLMSSLYALVSAGLENYGLSYLTQKTVAKRAASSWILKNAFSQLSKNVSKEMIEAQIMNSTKLYATRAAITTAGSSAVEAGVEMSQAAAQKLVQEAYDQIKGTEYFNNESAWKITGDILYEGEIGLLGAGMVESAQQSVDVLSRGVNALKNNDQIKLLITSANVEGIDNALLTNLKASMLSGKMSKSEAKEIVESFKEIKGKINSMPEDMSIDNKSVALDLMIERDNLNKKIEGKDPFLVVKEKERIGQINEQLKNLGNAVQEPSTESVLQREQEGVTEAGGERGGVEPIVQGEEVTREGETKAVQEEVVQGATAKIADVDIVYPTEPQAEERKAFRSTSEYVENASKELPVEDVETLTKELDGDFGLLTAENPMAQPLTEEENKQLNQKAEEWLTGRGYKPRRVTGKYGQAENSFFVPNLTRQDAIDFAKQFNQEAVAHSDGLVYQDGSMNPRVKADDNLSFTERYSPDSDFVSVVNTKDGLKTFSIGYNFDEKVMPEQQAATQVSEVTITPETSQTVTERINKETDTKRKKVFTAVQKVLSAIPNSRIILHDNVDAFVSGVAKSAGITNDEAISQGVNNNRGSYVNGDIHINLETAGVTTVFHEAFHDLLAKKGMENNALLDMAKGLKSVISDKALKTRLDDFVSNYEQGERAEEYTTELGAIMAEAQKELSTTKFQQFKTLVNKIAKKLGMPVVFSAASTAQDAVDFMNSMAGKLGKGDQIEVGNVSKVIPSETDKYGNLKKPSESSIKNIKNQKPKIVNDAKSNVKEGKTVSTRLPKKDNIHSTRDYIVSMKSLEEDASKDKKIQDQYIKIAKEISSYGISKIKNVENFDDAKKVVNDFKNSVKSNLKWLHNSFGVDVRDISKLWYDGANIICNKIANQYNYSLEQVSGVMAVLSPQMDWFRNLSLGERVIDIYTNQQNSIFDSKMIDYVNNATSGTGKNKVPLFKDSKEIISRVKNKKLSELNNKDKAYFIRVFDEVYNSREYNNISPNGEVNGLVRKSDGSPGACGWGAFPTIEKSISILQDGSIENISSNLGNMHKVRNFFNNISNPNDPDAVTIDTHAVAAGLLLPLSGSSKQVLYNFGGAGNVNTGMTGTYPVYADAYRELAKELGLLPREVQSITWEAVRGLFKATFKSNKNNELNINKVWDDYSSGSISLDEAHTKIEDIAGGISKPVWFEYMADGNKISMDENSAAVDQSNLDNESIEPSKIKAQIIGKNANLSQNVRDNLQVARDMEVAGKSVKDIRIATGWERGTDKKWRYEIDDNILILKSRLLDQLNNIEKPKTYGELSRIDINKIINDELIKLYPELSNTEIVINPTISYGEGYYIPSLNQIHISNNNVYLNNTASVLLHEIQHVIQNIEGFSVGSDINKVTDSVGEKLINEIESGDDAIVYNKLQSIISKMQEDPLNRKKLESGMSKIQTLLDNYSNKKYGKKVNAYAFDVYRRYAGEVEARNVEKRMNMTPEERRQTTLQETEDIAREDQIIFFNEEGIPSKIKAQKNVVLESKGLSNNSIKTIEDNYESDFGFYDFNWNKESGRNNFQEWLNNFESNQFDKNLSKVINLVKQDIDLLNERKIIEEKLNAFEELIIPAIGDDVLTKKLSLFEQQILMDPNATIESIEKGFKEAKNIFDKDGNIDKLKITSSNLFEGGEISLPLFEKFIEKNPEYKNVFDDWKKIFDRNTELILKKTNASGYNFNIKKLENLYNELNNIQSKSKIKAQKQSKEDAIQDAKDIHEKSFKRFKDDKRAIANAVNNLEKSKWYRDADDIQREEAVREIRKFFGEKLKAAPSIAKVTGKTKQTAFVSDLAAAIRDQVRLQARSSRETAKNINDRRKALGVAIKDVVKEYKGKITERQLNAINRKIANVNLFNQEMVERVIDYVNKVMNNAEYATKVNNAFAERRAIRRMMKSGNMAETVAVAKEFTQIDPSMVDDIDTYLEMAQKIRGAVKSSKRVKDSVSLKEIVNFGEAYEYINPVLKAQEESMKNMLLAEYNDLAEAGVISKDMTLKDINNIIKNIRAAKDEEVTAEQEETAREFLKQRLESIKSIISMVAKGYNPMTGEVMEISDRNKQMIAKVVKSDMNNMSTKQLIEMVDSLSNFVENGAVSGIEAAYETYIGEENAASLEREGVVAKIIKLYASKKIGDIQAFSFMSLPELFNRMFGGVKNGINVMTKMGFSDIILGANKARKLVEQIQKRYVDKFGDVKGFFDNENIYERGALAFLTRNVIGSEAEIKSEFNRRVDWLFESFERLKSGTAEEQKMAVVYGKIIDKLDIKSRDLEKIYSNADKTNVEAVNWWIEEWSKHYSDLSDVCRSVYNAILGKDTGYTPDRLKMTSKESLNKTTSKDLMDLMERNSSFLINTDAITNTNESGVMIASIRPEVKNTKGRYVSLDFEINNIDSLTGALVDINTAGAIRRLDSFMKSKSFDKIIPNTDDQIRIKKRINRYVRRIKNKMPASSDSIRDFNKIIDTAASLGASIGLGGAFQIVKQTVSVAMSTALQTGGNFNMYAGKSFNDWLDTTGATVANRGQESISAIESANKKIQSFSGNFDRTLKAVSKATQWQLKLVLSRPDVFVARAAFKSYYEQFLKDNGYDVSKINWDTWADTIKREGIEELNKEAIVYADTMVSRQQNVSDERLAGEALASENDWVKLARKVLLPFASFSINQRARLINDLITIKNKTASKEDVSIAWKSLFGTLVEQATFQAINYSIGMLLYSAAQGIAGHDDDEEEWEKRKKRATQYPLRSLAADITSPNPLVDDLFIDFYDLILSNMAGPSESEINKAINDEKKLREELGKDFSDSQIKTFREKYIEDNTYQLSPNYINAEDGKWGMLSIASDQVMRLSENSEMATKGTFTSDYQGKETTKYLTDKDRRIAQGVFYILDVPYTTGAGFKEMGQVANKTYSIIKKRALTENQYETYKQFKKDFKREPQEWEINIIKSTKSANNALGELDFIKEQGGLSPKQGVEYLNVFKKIGPLNPEEYRMIINGKKADQVIKSVLK